MERYAVTYYDRKARKNKSEIVEGISWISALKFLLESKGVIFHDNITDMLYFNAIRTIQMFNESMTCPIKIINVSELKTKVTF